MKIETRINTRKGALLLSNYDNIDTQGKIFYIPSANTLFVENATIKDNKDDGCMVRLLALE